MKKVLFSKKVVFTILIIIVISTLFIFFLLSRSSRDEFNFRLNFNVMGREQIDTYKNTFTKDHVMNGIKTIGFGIPVEVKDDIYRLMKEIDIMSFPDTLENAGLNVTPSSDYKLTVTMDGNTKTIIWKDGIYPGMSDDLPRYNADFLKLVKYIQDFIYQTDEYKNMPEANGGYQ